jgi:heme-degrading monooxygenase HmoA
MYIVTNRVPVADGYQEMFEERFRNRAGQIDKQTGFIRMQVLKPVTPDTPYLVQTTWRDKAAFEAWMGSEDFKTAHSNPMPKEAFSGQGRIEMFDVLIESAVDSAVD